MMKILQRIIKYLYKYGILVNNNNFYIIDLFNSRSRKISHLRNADGAFIVYDITNESSFETIEYWYEQIKLSSNDDIIIYLLGNKIDLNANRIISKKSGLEKAKKMGMDKFAEVSAKTKENLMEIFKEFYMEIYHKNKKKFMEKKNKNMKTFESLQKQENNTGGCC